MHTIRVASLAFAAAAAFGCSSKDSEPEGQVGQSLTRAELPAAADLHYDVIQPAANQTWKLDASIRLAGSGRRITLTRRSTLEESATETSADARGTFDARVRGDAVWRRFEPLSVPEALEIGREWTPFHGGDYQATGSGAVIDSSRTYRVVSLGESGPGLVYRAIYNIRPYVVRSGYEGDWPFADDVQGVGVAEWFIPHGSSQSYLVSQAEYRFLMDSRPATLAVHSQAELRARLGETNTFLTLTCLRGGIDGASTLTRERPAADRGLGLEQCDANL